jgi:MYXO-CTERM domain-containing protein
VIGITWWDVCDAGSWLQNGGLLRDDLSPKPVYQALQQLIHQEWHTSEQGTTDGQGQFGFSGFFGAYRVTASLGDESETGEFHLARGQENLFILVLPGVHIEQDGGIDAGQDAGIDAGTSDDGAGDQETPGDDGGDTEPEETADGCSCTSPGRGATAFLWILLGFLALIRPRNSLPHLSPDTSCRLRGARG